MQGTRSSPWCETVVVEWLQALLRQRKLAQGCTKFHHATTIRHASSHATNYSGMANGARCPQVHLVSNVQAAGYLLQPLLAHRFSPWRA